MEFIAQTSTSVNSVVPLHDKVSSQAGGFVALLDANPRLLPFDDSSTPLRPILQIKLSIESLPAEIRRLVLFSLASVEDMGSLVHASPIYHAQYLLDRKTFLRESLKRTLGLGTLIDAYGCLESRLRLILRPRTFKTVDRFLSDYHAWRSDPGIVVSQLNLAELSRIASFYLTSVRPLVCFFFGTFLANLKSQQVNSVSCSPPREISAAERSRIVRALYRFQIYCHTFGFIKSPVPGEAPGQVDDERVELIHQTYSLFEPWELEEISCVDVLIEEKYDRLFSELQWHFNSDNPKLANYGGSFDIFPEHLPRLGPELTKIQFVAGLASHGLRLFSKIITIHDQSQLDNVLTKNLRLPSELPLLHQMDLEAQAGRRANFPSIHDAREHNRELMKFAGDKPQDGKPALAWVIIWRGKYSSLCGEVIPLDMKRWGYVFWDIQRLVEHDAKPLLKIQWMNAWPHRDPRRLM